MIMGVLVGVLLFFTPTFPFDADRGTGAGSRNTTGASAVEAPLAPAPSGARTGPGGTVIMSTNSTRSTSSDEDDLFLLNAFVFAAAVARNRFAFFGQ